MIDILTWITLGVWAGIVITSLVFMWPWRKAIF